MGDVTDTLRRELGGLEPSRGGYEKTIERVQRRQRRRRNGAATLGLAISALLVVGVWTVLPSGRKSPQAPKRALAPGNIVLPDRSFLPEGLLLLRTGNEAEILRHGEARSETVATSDLKSLELFDVARDGSKVVGAIGRELVSVDTTTGKRSVLLRLPARQALGASAKWSPDGSRVAYSVGRLTATILSGRRYSDAPQTLCVYFVLSRSIRCWPEVGNVYSFDWAPGGNDLVVAGHPDEPLYQLDITAGRVSPLVSQKGSTPINRALAARGWGEGIQLVRPMWSPSGQFLAALVNLTGSRFAYVPVIFRPNGQPVAFGRPSNESPRPLGWSPVEDLLAYSEAEAPYLITAVRLLDPFSTEDRLLLSSEETSYQGLTDLAWSPSGRWVGVTLWRRVADERTSAALVVLDVTNGNRWGPAYVRGIGDSADPVVGWTS